MRWRKGSKSGNVEDRRSVGIPGGVAGGIGGLGLILLLLISIFLGVGSQSDSSRCTGVNWTNGAAVTAIRGAAEPEH